MHDRDDRYQARTSEDFFYRSREWPLYRKKERKMLRCLLFIRRNG